MDETLGARIRARREELGIQQVDLAEAVGVRPHTLWRYEAGQSRPKAETLDKIADALRTTTKALLYGDQVAETTSEAFHDDDAAPAPEDRIERVIEAMALDEDIADKLRRTKWTGGTPSENTLRSFAMDLELEKRQRALGRERGGPEAEKPRPDRGGMKLGAGKGKSGS